MALKELVEAGKLSPVIDGSYPLNETARAISRVATGRTRGTIVITVNHQVNAASAPTKPMTPASSPARLGDAAVAPIVASPPA
jgi:hypothetical protein